ncbi:MAG: DUF3017 domain-containing protein [Actinomycetes bacterium]
MDDEVELDGEGNPIDDEPFVDRVRDQWPLALVLGGMAIGLAIVAFGSFRAGSLVVAASVVFATFMRAFLPRDTAGMLAVRSRTIDVTTMGVLGVSLTVMAFLVPPPPV